jgi:hypothetical protein
MLSGKIEHSKHAGNVDQPLIPEFFTDDSEALRLDATPATFRE